MGAVILPIGDSDVLVCGLDFPPYTLHMDKAGNYVKREVSLGAVNAR